MKHVVSYFPVPVCGIMTTDVSKTLIMFGLFYVFEMQFVAFVSFVLKILKEM